MNTKQIRSIALGNVKQNWSLSIGAAILACIIAGWGSNFLPDLEFTWPVELANYFSWMQEWNHRVNADVTGTVRFNLLPSINLVHFILGGVVEIGYCIFLLNQHDGQHYTSKDLFSQFDRFGTGFAQKFLRELYVALWSLLLIIPGIVAAYSYAMTPYILAEHPDMSASEAITASKEMMDGHKADLFMLHLTFIGWDILAALTLNIGHLWLNPYRHAADAVFYRQLQANHKNL